MQLLHTQPIAGSSPAITTRKQEALCLSSSRPVKINVSGSLLVYPSVEAKLTPVCCIKCNDWVEDFSAEQQRRWPSRLHNEPHIFKGEYYEKENYSTTTKLPCQVGNVS